MAVSVALDHMPPTNTATGRSPQRPCQGQIPHALDHVARHFTSVRSKERSLQTNLALLLVEVRYVTSSHCAWVCLQRSNSPSSLIPTALPTFGVCCVD